MDDRRQEYQYGQTPCAFQQTQPLPYTHAQTLSAPIPARFGSSRAGISACSARISERPEGIGELL